MSKTHEKLNISRFCSSFVVSISAINFEVVPLSVGGKEYDVNVILLIIMVTGRIFHDQLNTQ